MRGQKVGGGKSLPSLSGAMHSNVTRNWYSSEKRAGLFRNVTSRMLTIDIVDTCRKGRSGEMIVGHVQRVLRDCGEGEKVTRLT